MHCLSQALVLFLDNQECLDGQDSVLGNSQAWGEVGQERKTQRRFGERHLGILDHRKESNPIHISSIE